ncbi:MAG TPA: radical SAM protein [Pseudobacteroides sp.]|uniref:radical SAM protein n=1 Tax=Pseudobacteroides sp. TaxID=1968840 RepID=UPI002F92AF87
MKVNEIFLSIQGESVYTGLPTVFVRFSGCNLRCSYCDTEYAYEDGVEMEPEEIFLEIQKYFYKRVCITGGEPLLQRDLEKLLVLLKDYGVTIETNGSMDISLLELGPKHSYVMDMKSLSSGVSEEMRLSNFEYLSMKDEIKFVVESREDYEWSKSIIRENHRKGTITISPVFGKIDYSELIGWILNDRLDVRFQIQLHKVIWGVDKRGV